MKLSNYEIRRRILRKMARHNMWGGKHMAFDNVPHGFPKELWRDVRRELEELVRDGLVVEKPAGYGLQVSLNVGKKAEIEEIIFSGD